jgi:hypothetical protein
MMMQPTHFRDFPDQPKLWQLDPPHLQPEEEPLAA